MVEHLVIIYVNLFEFCSPFWCQRCTTPRGRWRRKRGLVPRFWPRYRRKTRPPTKGKKLSDSGTHSLSVKDLDPPASSTQTTSLTPRLDFTFEFPSEVGCLVERHAHAV
jgi:hypothetical protein